MCKHQTPAKRFYANQLFMVGQPVCNIYQCTRVVIATDGYEVKCRAAGTNPDWHDSFIEHAHFVPSHHYDSVYV